MVLSTELCEACKINSISVEEESDDENQPYRLCQGCRDRLVRYSLKPIEWYNLAVIHSPKKFLLHDDFYDDDGEAAQPEEEVDVSDNDMAPSLEDVQNDMELLLDFSITRWFLDDDIIYALNQHDKISLLNSVKSRFYETVNDEVKSRMLEIAADVLGDIASDWVRELWDHYDENFIIQLSWATSSSLPAKEGLNYVFEKLQSLSDKQLPISAFSCLHRFRSNDVLDWIEKNCIAFHDHWGRLAALCFPTWERMKTWLAEGRPLSLVALDTMAKCAAIGNDPYVERFKPKILKTDMSEINTVLDSYYENDDVPRVKNKRERILDHKEVIFE
ncbi:MAG TPA: hypothetical protein DEO65_12655 [Bacillus bacterium]|uniref:Uncharacterized protein n=1 Tax=Siminovitchia fordii TaxID=254759 RepID=A0ABQ4K8E1_9BACI|nr:hypothetical protein [Siminovitchia fordii]GIN21231.1 hypothetical protein J1TS3_23650 [Siminovitchia fordii]HBZ10711.1 hypothetical protein [Bacillus sp. (in: firmicutes)]